MAVAENIDGSILSTVVEHERGLLTELATARDEARGVVDAARSEAIAYEDAQTASLNEDLAKRRAEAERVRTDAYDATLQAAEDQLAGTRETVRGRIGSVADEVLALFVPQSGKGE